MAWRGQTRFQKVLRQQGVQHVRSAPHHPMTLGKIERFWQTIWREFLEESFFSSFADACRHMVWRFTPACLANSLILRLYIGHLLQAAYGLYLIALSVYLLPIQYMGRRLRFITVRIRTQSERIA